MSYQNHIKMIQLPTNFILIFLKTLKINQIHPKWKRPNCKFDVNFNG